MQTEAKLNRMGESEKVFQHLSDPFNNPCEGLPMPNRKIPEILPIPQDEPFVRHIPLTQGKVAIVDASDFDWLPEADSNF